MQAESSHLLLTHGVSTRTFAVYPPKGRADDALAPVPTLAQYAAAWLESIEGLVRPRTLEDYTGRLERHVLPRLGERRLDEIGIDDLWL